MARLKPGAMLLHSAAVAVMTRAWFHLDKLPNNAWLEKEVGGHLQLLTIQGLLAAWATMSLSLLVDVVPSRTLTKIKRALFMIAMPLAAVISSTYWPLLLLSPHLILRAAQPEPTSSFSPSSSEVPELTLVRIPLTLDLSIHAVPTIALTLDFFLFEVKYPVKTALVGGAPSVVALAAVLYGSWVEYCASYNRKFPYPYLTKSEFPVRVQIYAGSALFAYIVFQGLNALHS